MIREKSLLCARKARERLIAVSGVRLALFLLLLTAIAACAAAPSSVDEAESAAYVGEQGLWPADPKTGITHVPVCWLALTPQLATSVADARDGAKLKDITDLNVLLNHMAWVTQDEITNAWQLATATEGGVASTAAIQFEWRGKCQATDLAISANVIKIRHVRHQTPAAAAGSAVGRTVELPLLAEETLVFPAKIAHESMDDVRSATRDALSAFARKKYREATQAMDLKAALRCTLDMANAIAPKVNPDGSNLPVATWTNLQGWWSDALSKATPACKDFLSALDPQAWKTELIEWGAIASPNGTYDGVVRFADEAEGTTSLERFTKRALLHFLAPATDGTAIHEIGHELAIAHEHQRTDQVDCAKPKDQTDSAENWSVDGALGVRFGAYDKKSIMNYCSGAKKLSAGDVAGVRYYYGRGGVTDAKGAIVRGCPMGEKGFGAWRAGRCRCPDEESSPTVAVATVAGQTTYRCAKPKSWTEPQPADEVKDETPNDELAESGDDEDQNNDPSGAGAEGNAQTEECLWSIKCAMWPANQSKPGAILSSDRKQLWVLASSSTCEPCPHSPT